MRSPVSRVAAAAIFVLAIAGVALWFHGGGTTPAFADFLQPLLEAKTVKYKITTEVTSPLAGTTVLSAETQKDLLTQTAVVMMLDANRSRTEMGNGEQVQEGGYLGWEPRKESHAGTRGKAGHGLPCRQHAQEQDTQGKGSTFRIAARRSWGTVARGLLSFATARCPRQTGRQNVSRSARRTSTDAESSDSVSVPLTR